MKLRNFLRFTIALSLISIFGFQVIEDPNFLNTLKETLRDFNATYPEEKVYLQSDKPFYKPGEDIWLNVFVLNSNTHKPSAMSDVVYVELVDPKGNVASRLDLVIKEGTAQGDFQLQETAPGGLYQIRAYTRWMKNFGDDSFFKKEVAVQKIITPRLLLKLDFEKESYGPGDQVTAKLFVTNLKNLKVANASIHFSARINNIPLTESSIVSDEAGLAMIRFTLPDTLNTVDGLLQAIVSNQGVEESISRSIPIVLNKIAIQFFPEGGQWVENVNSRVGFKALNEFGKGADVSGSIVDEQNNVVASFASFHMGMGAFQFTPLPAKKYFARIENPLGNTSLTPLPEPQVSGLALSLKNKTKTVIDWSIHSPNPQDIYLVGQSHGELYYGEKIALKTGNNVVTVPTEKFPVGIAVFTVFNAEGLEQCERLAFLNQDNGLVIRLKSNKQQYLPREKVDLTVETVNAQGDPIPAKVSLAVVDDQVISFADDKQDNLLSSMLLSSEVKGEIQEPSFYFDSNESKAAQALDYLLMTQGWRRFNWKNVYDKDRIITHSPEKVKNITGNLVNNNGAGYAGEVSLLELGGRKRITKVYTTPQGHFLFKNIDPTIPILLLTKKPGEISIQKERTFSVSLNDKEGIQLFPEANQGIVGFTTNPPAEGATDENVDSDGAFNMGLSADVTQLSEVVVTSYGVENKQSLTGSITTVTQNSLETMAPTPAIENLLAGRVAGVQVQPQTGNPGAQSNITIRGISSLAGGRSEPLYVIDGHPIGTSLNQSFSNGSMIGPDDIESIEILKSPESTAIFGSRAANGVIMITTRSRIGYTHFQRKKKAARYSSATIVPRKFSPTREFYAAPPSKSKNEIRNDFRSTVYWNHTIVTNEKGEAKISFYNTDAVSAFRITAEGFSGSGLLGRKEEVYFTELPLSLDAKLPEVLGFEDVLKLPVRVKNETASPLSCKVTLALASEFAVEESLVRNIQVQPESTQTVWFTISPKGIEGEFPIVIKLESEDFADEIKHTIRVKAIGFPMRLSFSAKELDKTITFSISDAEKKSVKAELVAFPDVLSDLFTGAESILREPHGCFEQVSSSTFPNILALQFLKQSGLAHPATEKKALEFIRKGYEQLAAYEIKGGGFEWFGHPPAHEGLSAYGLLEFHEMKKVFGGVNEEMVTRTRDWLLSRRTGKGGYSTNAGKYGFSAASDEVTNAYITYALSETGTTDILKEYNLALSEALKSKDMYRMALVAATAFNLGKLDDYASMVKFFKEYVDTHGVANMKADHSMVRSYGTSLQCETLSLWTIALMKTSSFDLDLINVCIQQILKSRSYGQFGSTQGTTLALKALTEYAILIRTTRDDGVIQIFVDNAMTDNLFYEKNTREKLRLNSFSEKLYHGDEQTMRVVFRETKTPLPYSVNIQWYTKKPPSSDLCKVNVTTSLSATSVRVNETIRMTTTLKNKSSEGQPMTVAVLGIPAGLSTQPWQLKELQQKGVFDFYEIINGNLVLYYREMAPHGQQIINLDLKAEIPGSYVGAASSAYLYYTNEYKHWVKGNAVTVLN